MPGGRQRAREVVEAVLRRPRLVVGPLVVALLVALAASWLAPVRYRASAHVRAQWSSADGVNASSLAAELAERRFRAVRQRVLARSPTEGVTVRPGEADDFFIECVHADPAMAARVPNLLASLLVEEAARERPEGSGADRKALDARLAGARQAMAQAEAAIVQFRRQALPASEAIPTLERLAREYGEARKAYLEIEDQVNAAEAASRIGAGDRVRFTVLESASPPSTPFSPNPTLFAAVGAALGLVAGLGAAVLAELRDRSVKGPEDLAETLPFLILAEIPLVQARRPGRRAPTRGGSGGA